MTSVSGSGASFTSTNTLPPGSGSQISISVPGSIMVLGFGVRGPIMNSGFVFFGGLEVGVNYQGSGFRVLGLDHIFEFWGSGSNHGSGFQISDFGVGPWWA